MFSEHLNVDSSRIESWISKFLAAYLIVFLGGGGKKQHQQRLRLANENEMNKNNHFLFHSLSVPQKMIFLHLVNKKEARELISLVGEEDILMKHVDTCIRGCYNWIRGFWREREKARGNIKILYVGILGCRTEARLRESSRMNRLRLFLSLSRCCG